jgi:hypothetical protein
MAQVKEFLLSKCEALSSNPSTENKKREREQNRRKDSPL